MTAERAIIATPPPALKIRSALTSDEIAAVLIISLFCVAAWVAVLAGVVFVALQVFG